ncbi:MAG TPA: DUF4124 domain-containing protein [Gammaproteobacteria bacterium]|nr:DUF4124 domain-containing protein [Gammaproteobacteria bacterium]
MRAFTILLILCLCAPALADQKVYKTVGPNGEVTFSDKPSPGAKEMDVPPAPSYKAPPLPVLPQSPSDTLQNQTQQTTSRYQLVSIVAPANDQTVVNTAGKVQVTVLIQPPLKAGRGDEVRIRLDGKVVKTGNSPNVTLDNVNRGTHTVSAAVVDRDGNTLIESSSNTFHLHRPSIHLPGRKKPNP